MVPPLNAIPTTTTAAAAAVPLSKTKHDVRRHRRRQGDHNDGDEEPRGTPPRAAVGGGDPPTTASAPRRGTTAPAPVAVTTTAAFAGSGARGAARPPPPPLAPRLVRCRSNKTMKRPSPFRIKTGCLVAWRAGGGGGGGGGAPPAESLQLSWVEAKEEEAAAAARGGGAPAVSACHADAMGEESPTHGTAAPVPGPPPPRLGRSRRTRTTRTVHLAAPDYVTVWTPPLAARDCHWALVGKRIRCSIPVPNTKMRATGTDSHANGTTAAAALTAAVTTTTTIVLEGEVVRYLGLKRRRTTAAPKINFVDDEGDGEVTTIRMTSANDNDGHTAFQVELLINTKLLRDVPFLTRSDDADRSSRKQGLNPAEASPPPERGQRYQQLEERIRGVDKATVVIMLQHPLCYNNSNGPPSLETGLTWAVQKRVPAALFSSKPLSSSSSSRQKVAANGAMMNVDDVGGAKTGVVNNGDDVDKVGGTSNGEGSCANGANGRTAAIEKKSHERAIDATASAAIIKKQETREATKDGASLLALSVLDATARTTVKRRRESATLGAAPSAAAKPVGTASAHKKKRRSHAGGGAVATRHVGDGNDSPAQQVANWRWLAARYHDMLLSAAASAASFTTATSSSAPMDTMGANMLSAGFIGEVVSVHAAGSHNSSNNTTLALVTVRRLFLPEHTASGRLPHHEPDHVFEDYDLQTAPVHIVVPIEQLVILVGLRRPLQQHRSDAGPHLEGFVSTAAATAELGVAADVAPLSYSFNQNMYFSGPRSDDHLNKYSQQAAPAAAAAKEKSFGIPVAATSPDFDYLRSTCHRCRRLHADDDTQCSSPDERPLPDTSDDDDGHRRRCHGTNGCLSCVSIGGSVLHAEFNAAFVLATKKFHKKKSMRAAPPEPNPLLLAASILRSATATAAVDFGLPLDFLDCTALQAPRAKPSTRVRSPKMKTRRTPTAKNRLGRFGRKRAEKQSIDDLGTEQHEIEDYSVFKPTCAREIVYDPSKKRCFSKQGDDTNPFFVPAEKPRNLRDKAAHERGMNFSCVEKKNDDIAKASSSSSRAARVSQRRLLKDVASFGVASLGLVDALASREQQLRFDRSGIHAWGVFADAAISAGEMIVEYRGELIGNAVAERREIEYEVAKIGSDYMFRIDSLNVCDATKQGNVARFVNASCDPNCYTKIISLDGTKRIVIYAKKDIGAGEELCYDYKFPLEYDESKRIPCHCGSKRECRGFMNWDKRYVVSPGVLEPLCSPVLTPLKYSS